MVALKNHTARESQDNNQRLSSTGTSRALGSELQMDCITMMSTRDNNDPSVNFSVNAEEHEKDEKGTELHRQPLLPSRRSSPFVSLPPEAKRR